MASQPKAPTPVVLDDADVVAMLKTTMLNYRTDVVERNTYMDKRDRYLYGDGLWESLTIPDGFDRTFYNYLLRVVDIHTSQLFGQDPGIYSYYDKDDLSIFKKDDQNYDAELESAELNNKMAQTRSDGRKQAVESIIRDNGGYQLFTDGAREGAAFGSTLYQMWWDRDEKKIRIQLLESPQNWFPIWRDSNFRDRDGDAYVYQISKDQAYMKYGDKLPDGAIFQTTISGDPLLSIQGTSSTAINQGETVSGTLSRMPMVTVINFTGYVEGLAYNKKGEFIKVENGQETKVSFKVVGDQVMEKITDDKYMPTIYYIPNRRVLRRPYGESDLPESALEINATIIERMSDLITLASKTLFPLVQAKGFTANNIPSKPMREIKVVPMNPDQALEVVNMPTAFGMEYDKIIAELKEALVRVTGISLALFDDGQVASSGSNQQTITSMKSIIDVVEDKQKRWEPVITKMFTDALHLAAEFDDGIKNLLGEVDDKGKLQEDNWWFYIRWPSFLRKDDPTYQAMLLNELHANVLSVDSYMELSGRIIDPTEEMNRLQAVIKDPVRAAIQGNMLGTLAHYTILKDQGIPPWGYNLPHITLKGDLTPQQEANMAQNYGWNDGPYGASIGPQGLEGERANENEVNQGFAQFPPGQPSPYAKYGFPMGVMPGQVITPQPPPGAPGMPSMTPGPGSGGQTPGPIVPPGMNQPGAQPMSQPGVAAPTPMSPGGAVNHSKQHGK